LAQCRCGFVDWSELERALDDGSLTVLELEDMESLIQGGASFYTETLHPDGVKVPMINLVALGMLEDGRSFQVHVVYVTEAAPNICIAFECRRLPIARRQRDLRKVVGRNKKKSPTADGRCAVAFARGGKRPSPTVDVGS
jgi:hypothetical protein